MCKDKLLLAQILSYNSLFVTFRVSIHLNKICFCPLLYSLFCSFYSSLSSVPSITVDKKGSYTIYIHTQYTFTFSNPDKKGQIWIEIREIVFNLEVLSYTNIHTHLLLLICCKKGIFCSKIDHCDEY